MASGEAERLAERMEFEADGDSHPRYRVLLKPDEARPIASILRAAGEAVKALEALRSRFAPRGDDWRKDANQYQGPVYDENMRAFDAATSALAKAREAGLCPSGSIVSRETGTS